MATSNENGGRWRQVVRCDENKDLPYRVFEMKTDQSYYDRSVDIVRNAIPRMSELKIPITPVNYAVWYEFLSDSVPDLTAAMNALLHDADTVSGEAMRDLYERFIEDRDNKLETAKKALAEMLKALMTHLGTADQSFDHYSGELHDIADSLSDDTSAEDLNALMDRALRATNVALTQGVEMKKQLTHLADEMQHMRAELERTHEAARIDALTGLCNRRVFDEALESLPSDSKDDAHTPCLLIIDIDHFKRVNDTYGHQAGDEVLKHVADEIKASVRGRDLVARLGGEEFAVLLRDTPRSGCKAVAEHIRINVRLREAEVMDETGFPIRVKVTLSVGGAYLRSDEPTDAFVARADRALYQAKSDGRDRVMWEGREAAAE